jgi:DNA-binding NtrC family response regulator
MLPLIEQLPALSKASEPLLIVGGSGVGKMTCARLIHEGGGRREKPFELFDQFFFPIETVTEELFGSVFARAAGGTLAIRYINVLPLSDQRRLVSALHDEAFTRHDVRLICTGNPDVGRQVETGKLDPDLLALLTLVRVPSLGERKEDLPTLAKALVAEAAASRGRPTPELTADAIEALMQWGFPGNVRELSNLLGMAEFKTPEGPITASSLPGWKPLPPATDEQKRQLVDAWDKCDGNLVAMANLLQLSRRTVVNRVRELGLTRDRR